MSIEQHKQKTNYLIFFVLVIIVLLSFILLFFGENTINNNNNISNPNNSFSSDVEKNLLPEIKMFLTQHKEFGHPVSVVNQPDWAQGKRQTVRLVGINETDDYLFYTQNGEVVTVYKLNSETTNERIKIWEK